MVPVSSDPCRNRRAALLDRWGDGLILVRGAGAAEGRNPNFAYLTGLAEPRAALLMSTPGVRIGTGRMHPGPDYVRGRMARQLLFLPVADPLLARWGEEGTATLGGVRAEDAGVDAVLSSGELETVLGAALQSASRLYLVRGWPASVGGEDDPDTVFAARLRRRFFDLEVRDGSRAVHEMRRLKGADEVARIERAIAVTAEALERAFAAAVPGAQEHEVEAEITRVYRRHGATHAFEPIVGSGANAVLLHYVANSGPVRSGELLLLDTGCALDGYVSDVTRTIPVGGRFNPRQREVYEAVLRAQEAAFEACRPGALLGEIHARTYDVLRRAGFGPHYIHGTSHHLGLETHDVGDVHAPLAPGAVITVEPGAYLADEALGVRVEDDVLITETGCRVLSAAIPRTIEQLEARLGAVS
ncbi:MAG TPA: M24 family metallopeptidase [Candidatus Polarisedimenticolaceae bacterium]|nr:M24 family metallopeptidase [Candidatus Polarisedimenticolaceae bacterium]